jgi:hypothetical protein
MDPVPLSINSSKNQLALHYVPSPNRHREGCFDHEISKKQ